MLSSWRESIIDSLIGASFTLWIKTSLFYLVWTSNKITNKCISFTPYYMNKQLYTPIITAPFQIHKSQYTPFNKLIPSWFDECTNTTLTMYALLYEPIHHVTISIKYKLHQFHSVRTLITLYIYSFFNLQKSLKIIVIWIHSKKTWYIEFDILKQI